MFRVGIGAGGTVTGRGCGCGRGHVRRVGEVEMDAEHQPDRVDEEHEAGGQRQGGRADVEERRQPGSGERADEADPDGR